MPGLLGIRKLAGKHKTSLGDSQIPVAIYFARPNFLCIRLEEGVAVRLDDAHSGSYSCSSYRLRI